MSEEDVKFFDINDRFICILDDDNEYALKFYSYMSNKYKLSPEELSKHFVGLCKESIKKQKTVSTAKELSTLGIPWNQGKKWSPADVKTLRKLFDDGKSIDHITKVLGRSSLSILLAFRKYILKNNVLDMDAIIKKYPILEADDDYISIVKTGNEKLY